MPAQRANAIPDAAIFSERGVQKPGVTADERTVSHCFERLASATTDVLAYVGRDYTYRAVNEQYLERRGKRREDVIGRTVMEVTGTEFFENVAGPFIDRSLAGETIRDERLIEYPGGAREVETTFLPDRDADGSIHGVSICMRDITEHKEVEERLQFTQFAVDNAATSAFWIAADGRLLYVNSAACQSLGYTPEELLDASVSDIAPEFPDELWRQFFNDLRGGEAATFEALHQRKDGTCFPVEVTIEHMAYRGEDYACAFAQDITGRKQAERQLEYTQFAVDNAADPVVLLDKNGRLFYVNDAECTTLGYSREELLRMRIADIDTEFPEHLWEQTWQELRRSGRLTLYGRNRRKDGSTFPVEVTVGTGVYDGEEFGMAFIRDITEAASAERALRESEEKFSKAFRSSPHTMAVTTLVDGRLIEINAGFERMFGYSAAESIGRTTVELNLWAEPEQRDAMIARVRAGENVDNLEIDVLTRSGKRLSCLLSAEAIEMHGESCMVVSIMDVTERKRTEEALRVSEERFSKAFHSSPDVVTLTTLDGDHIIDVNESFEQVTGFSRAEVIGKSTFELDLWVDIQDRTTLGRVLTDGGLVRAMEVDLRMRSGEVRQFQISAEEVEIEGKLCIVTTTRDISDQKGAQLALKQERDFVSQILDTAGALVCVMDHDGRIVRFNKACEQCTGYQAEEVLGRKVWEFMLLSEEVEAVKGVFHDLREHGMPNRFDNYILTKSGEKRFISWTNSVLRDEHADINIIIGTGLDITEAHELSKQLSYQAAYDSLTGLVNRHEFEQRVQRVLETARDRGSEHAICYVDLDQFKVINDTCGHSAGDELLRQLGPVLQAQVRSRDTLARLGGDEFGVLVENCTLASATRVADAIRKAIQDFRFAWEDKTFTIGASIGLVPIDARSESMADVLSAADTACYAAKDQGRNRVHVSLPDDKEIAQRHGEMQWVAKITAALEENRFRIFTQPIVPMAATRDVGNHIELLLRMEDEDGQIVPPGAFLPAAERYNLAPHLDRWVISTLFEWFEGHPRELDALHLCSVNLSGQSLGDEELPRMLNDYFDRDTIAPTKICFEITETAAISNLSVAMTFITLMKERGCSFALDDFGSGLSSFAYLKNLPVDFIKIDGVFVKDIVDDPIDLAMVKSINAIGQVMGKQTIAEFVENDAILAMLQDIGVDYAQGYGIARPQPIDALGGNNAP